MPAALLAGVLAAWAWLAGPLGPDIPAVSISYLGRMGAVHGARPESIAGMIPVAPEAAEAILYAGGFDFGATAAMQAAMDAAPRARLIAFDSPGGRPLAAEGVANLIRARHLDTTVSHFCASACTIAYAAGALRTATADARIAFHLGTGPFLAGLAATVVVQVERRWFIRAGASLTFAERALHAPNLDPYIPAIDELIAAGYVHHGVGKAFVAPDAAGPVTSAVRLVEPWTAAALRRGAAERVRAGLSPARAMAIAEQSASLVVDRWMSRTSDTALLEMVDARVAALETLGGQNAEDCMLWQVALQDQDVAAAALPAPMRARLDAAGVHVLRDANAYPLPVPADDGTAATADATVRRSIAAQFGQRALVIASSPEHGLDDPARSCAVNAAYLRGLREQAEPARVLRWALAAG